MTKDGVKRSGSRKGSRQASTPLPPVVAPGVVEVLDETISALTALDCTRLETLLQAVNARIATSGMVSLLPREQARRQEQFNEIAARQRLLGRLLESTELNLNVLEGLNRRNRMGEAQWVR